MTEECFVCSGEPIAVSPDGLAVAVPFRAPQFEGHVVVGTRAHRDLGDVTDAEWAAVGRVIRERNAVFASQPGFEKTYLVAIGDADRGHLHFHLVPKAVGDLSLGPFVFGPSGWLSSRS